MAAKSRRSTKTDAAREASHPNGREPSTGPRRSALLQARSRNTRRQLVRTALAMWDERGFEHGVEETTVEEIARAAGVTKGTFYFHFAHKEDILLEIGWAAAEAMATEATAAMQRGRAASEVIDTLMASLARRVSRVPRAAVIRSAAEFARRSRNTPAPPDGAVRFEDAFASVVAYAMARGDLPHVVDGPDLAAMLESVTMNALLEWAAGGESVATLRRRLQRRAEVIFTGASVVYGWRLPPDGAPRSR